MLFSYGFKKMRVKAFLFLSLGLEMSPSWNGEFTGLKIHVKTFRPMVELEGVRRKWQKRLSEKQTPFFILREHETVFSSFSKQALGVSFTVAKSESEDVVS